MATAFLLLHPAPTFAQQPVSIQWWHAALVAGGTATLFLIDEPVRDFALNHQSGTQDDLATVFRQLGEPVVALWVGAVVIAEGLLLNKKAVTHTGLRLTTSVALAASTGALTKFIIGRGRPDASDDATDFEPFGRRFTRGSLPSGHTAAAFAIATTVADELDHPAVSVGAYALATATGWSRIYDNRHWFSDVALGAVFGVASAKLVSGRWTIFGLEPPGFLTERTEGGTSIGELALGIGAGIALGVLLKEITGFTADSESSAASAAPTPLFSVSFAIPRH